MGNMRIMAFDEQSQRRDSLEVRWNYEEMEGAEWFFWKRTLLKSYSNKEWGAFNVDAISMKL